MRYLKLLAVIFVVIAALLVFPNRIPEFAGLWLAWCAFRLSQGKLCRYELLVIPVWLLIKFPEPIISLFLFGIASAVSGLWFPETRKSKAICSLVVSAMWLFWITQHHLGAVGESHSYNLGGPIVCLGDSLTDYGYPDELRKSVPLPIEDYGFNGYTTEDGLKLVQEVVELKPAKVIIELGGHDFKNGNSRVQTINNMRDMIESFRDCGAEVVLVSIPRGFISDPWYGFERQLARQYDLDLVPDTMIRRLVYWSPIVPPGSLVPESYRFSEDGLHPNENGNRMMAKKIAGYLD